MYFSCDFGKNHSSVFKKSNWNHSPSLAWVDFKYYFKTSGWFFSNHSAKKLIFYSHNTVLKLFSLHPIFIFLKEVNFMVLDCSNNGLLSGLETLLRNVFIPSLQAQNVSVKYMLNTIFSVVVCLFNVSWFLWFFTISNDF